MNRIFYTLFLCSLVQVSLSAQTITPVAFNLNAPIDVNADADGNIWITESGSGTNDGQVLRWHPDTQILDTIITGLPSYFNFMAEELQGPLSARLMDNGRIFVNQGAGIDTAAAAIIEFNLDDYNQNAGPLTVSNYRSIVKVGEWALANGFAESNPYSFVFDAAGNYIIADAAANAIFKYEIATQSFSIIAEIPSFPNPLPFGPPFVQPVPTKILTHPDGGWLVGTLTGFPFADGAAKVHHIQADGSSSVYAEGLTLITDMAFDPNDGQLIVQQFGQFGQVDSTLSFIFNSAQTIKVDAEGNLDTLLMGFGPSPGMAIAADGSVYMTHLFLGQLLKAEGVLTNSKSPIALAGQFEVFPNPNNGQFQVTIDLQKSSRISYQLFDQMGRMIYSEDLGLYTSGKQQIEFNPGHDHLLPGVFYLALETDDQVFTKKILIK